MIRENNNSALSSCFIVLLEISICMVDYPNYDITPPLSDVTAYAISAASYPGIILSIALSCLVSTFTPTE